MTIPLAGHSYESDRLLEINRIASPGFRLPRQKLGKPALQCSPQDGEGSLRVADPEVGYGFTGVVDPQVEPRINSKVGVARWTLRRGPPRIRHASASGQEKLDAKMGENGIRDPAKPIDGPCALACAAMITGSGLLAAKVNEFSCHVPKLGDQRCDPQYTVTDENDGSIDVTLTDIPRKTHVKAVACQGRGKIGHARGWASGEEGETTTLAAGVPSGTCFQLSFSGDGPFSYEVDGRVEH